MTAARATVSADGKTVTLKGALWQDSFPAERLPGWLAFYRRLEARNAGAYAASYTPVVRALERAQKIINSYTRSAKP